MVEEFKEVSQDQQKEKLKEKIEEAIKRMQENSYLQEPPTSREIQENPVIFVNPTQEDVSVDKSPMEVSEPIAENKVSVITDFAS